MYAKLTGKKGKTKKSDNTKHAPESGACVGAKYHFFAGEFVASFAKI